MPWTVAAYTVFDLAERAFVPKFLLYGSRGASARNELAILELLTRVTATTEA